MRKKRILIPIIILASLAISLPLAFRLINHTNGSLISSGETRRFLIHVPDNLDPSHPVPLVISIHGFAEWPAHQMQVSGWNELADQHGFIVVYPSGTQFPLRWRSEGGFSEPDALQDVIFISDLIAHLRQDYNIDPNRIYANGLSNGAGMSFLLSCELSDQIAAVGLVAGAYFLPWESCQPDRPVPAIVFHGTADPIVPFNGGPSRMFDLPFPDIPTWVSSFAAYQGCQSVPLSLEPVGAVTGVSYLDCDADLVSYTIDGGGHTWPGGDALPEWIAGTTNRDINATELMWEFFQQHPLP